MTATLKWRTLPRIRAAKMGAEGGASTTESKADAARTNGKLGGRPAKDVAIRVGNHTVCISARDDRYGFSKRDIEDVANEFGYHRIAPGWSRPMDDALWVICGLCGDLRRAHQRTLQSQHQRKCEGKP